MTRVAPGWEPKDDLAADGFYTCVVKLYEAAGCTNVRVTEPYAGTCYVLYEDGARRQQNGRPGVWSRKFYRPSLSRKMSQEQRMELDLSVVPAPPLLNPQPATATERLKVLVQALEEGAKSDVLRMYANEYLKGSVLKVEDLSWVPFKHASDGAQSLPDIDEDLPEIKRVVDVPPGQLRTRHITYRSGGPVAGPGFYDNNFGSAGGTASVDPARQAVRARLEVPATLPPGARCYTCAVGPDRSRLLRDKLTGFYLCTPCCRAHLGLDPLLLQT